MARPEPLSRPPPADNALGRAVGRVPVRARTKLLVAFAGIAVLLVVVALLGLRVLGQANSRVESLGALQLRAATYQTLQTQAQQLRQLLAVRVADDPGLSLYVGGSADEKDGSRWTLVDQAIGAATSQLGPATNPERFGFVPPRQDEALLRRIRAAYRRFSKAQRRISASDRSGAKSKPFLADAIDADNALGALTVRLAAKTRAQTEALVEQNRAAYARSRNLFLVVGAASIALALLAGLVLSWALIRPIQLTEGRLAEIAAGDFSRHLEVVNRDELGSLALNLNRMNDELRRLYEELESASRHKSEFLAHMSHELRTPLNAIIGFSELLQTQSFGELNDVQLGYVNDVLDSGRHLLILINDVLDLSKIEAGKVELDIAEVSLRHVLESGLTMQSARAARDGITLGMTLDPDEITVEADERRLRQVALNLLSNAVNFTPAGGRVDVSARRSDNTVAVAVTDTGRGIAAADLDLIFEEFGQARSDGSARPEGTGLGLPLSRKIVELHGGRLWAESNEGEGSTFRFTLPLAQPR